MKAQDTTFPHHRHTGIDATIGPSEERNLKEIMRKIEADLKKA